MEAVEGSGYRAAQAIGLFDQLGIPYTGNRSQPMMRTCDKPLAKRNLAARGIANAGLVRGAGLDWIVGRRDLHREVGAGGCFDRFG